MRKLSIATLAGTSLMALAMPAHAQTLREALARAYNSNPTIAGERATLRASDENVPIARAAGLPTVTSDTGYTENVLNSGNSLTSPDRQANAGLNLTVPVYTAGAVSNSVRAAETRVEAGRSSLRNVEANLFTDVVAAYMDVIRDEAIVGLNQQNARVLGVNLQATRDRFEVGDLTRTDVAQSEARLALANAQLRSAEARLITSRENYIRIVGTPPGTLETPPPLPNLPNDPQVAVTTALDNNPALEAAQRNSDATRYDINVARSARSPRVNVLLGGNYYDYLGSYGAAAAQSLDQSGFGTTAGLSLSLPLFQGGRPAAQVRQAEARRSAAIETTTATERAVIAQTRSAYATWQSAQRVIESSQVAVDANRLSLEGVRAENSVGTRTILDILNAEQELLNAQVQLVTARRDAYVAGFALLASMGQAEARDLGLDGGTLYDPTVNYNRVRRKISDFGSDGVPDPVGTRTVDTPAQTPVVTDNPELGDPALQRPVDTTPRNPAGVRR